MLKYYETRYNRMTHISPQEENIIKEMRRQRSKLDYEEIIQTLQQKHNDLNNWEQEFIMSLTISGTSLSPAQKKALERMYAKYLEENKK